MRHLFSPEGELALALAVARHPLLAFDFDGTLAPIAACPQEATVPLPVARRLERLAQRLPIAVITGRTRQDARERLGFEPHFLIGNHGAQAAHMDHAPHDPILDPARSLLNQHGEAFRSGGVHVEDKGQSIALHYRLARHQDLARRTIEQVVSTLGPSLRIFGGKKVVNIAPAGAPDKAQALAATLIGGGMRHALFLGDDANDEPVFARHDPDWLTVRVGREDPHSQADFGLDSTSEVAVLLDKISSRL